MTTEVINVDGTLTDDVIDFFAALVLREMERRAAETKGEKDNENVHS